MLYIKILPIFFLLNVEYSFSLSLFIGILPKCLFYCFNFMSLLQVSLYYLQYDYCMRLLRFFNSKYAFELPLSSLRTLLKDAR